MKKLVLNYGVFTDYKDKEFDLDSYTFLEDGILIICDDVSPSALDFVVKGNDIFDTASGLKVGYFIED